jgi:hypothetical protein
MDGWRNLSYSLRLGQVVRPGHQTKHCQEDKSLGFQ